MMILWQYRFAKLGVGRIGESKGNHSKSKVLVDNDVNDQDKDVLVNAYTLFMPRCL